MTDFPWTLFLKHMYKNQYFSEVVMIYINFYENFPILENKALFVIGGFCTPCFWWLNISFSLGSFVLYYFLFTSGVMNYNVLQFFK